MADVAHQIAEDERRAEIVAGKQPVRRQEEEEPTIVDDDPR